MTNDENPRKIAIFASPKCIEDPRLHKDYVFLLIAESRQSGSHLRSIGRFGLKAERGLC